MIKNAIVISDTHFGCQLGLCPPKVKLEQKGDYTHSKLQKKVWQMWNEFWDKYVPLWTKGDDYILIHNGDIIDGVHHNAVTQITQNLEVQRSIAYEVMKPIVDLPKCKKYYQIKGTEAHVGKSAQEEEALAKMLNATPDKNGNYARWDLWLKLCSSLIHFTHHVGNTNSASYESTAVYKEMVEAFNEAGRWGDRPPDVVVRSHRHRQFETRIATQNGYGIFLVTPCWQLKTPFSYRIGLGRSSTPQIGGYLIRHGNEDLVYTRFKIWKIERSETENA